VQNWIIGTVTLLSCILFNLFAKSYFKQLSVLFGLVVGYILAVCMHQVDFSALANTSIIAFPHIMPFKMEFNLNAIVSVTLNFPCVGNGDNWRYIGTCLIRIKP